MIKLFASLHARERARERMSWHHRTLERMLDRVFYAGLGADECADALQGYVSSRQSDTELLPRIYGEYLFLFNRASVDEVVLLTVYRLPSGFRNRARRARGTDWNALAA
jgi:hypothetical protein